MVRNQLLKPADALVSVVAASLYRSPHALGQVEPSVAQCLRPTAAEPSRLP